MKFGTWDVYASGLLLTLPQVVLDYWADAIDDGCIPRDTNILVFEDEPGEFTWVRADADPAIYQNESAVPFEY